MNEDGGIIQGCQEINLICKNEIEQIDTGERKTYKVSEVSQILRISLRSAYNLCESEKQFPIIKIGTSVRIPKKQFDEWFDSCSLKLEE